MQKVPVALLAGVVCCAFVPPVPAAEATRYAYIEKLLYSFCRQENCTDGFGPAAGLIDVHGVLYGTTVWGGDPDCVSFDGCGTVFSIDPGTGVETVLHPFAGGTRDGTFPAAGLIDIKGKLYGTTEGGGGDGCGGGGCGTVFVIDRKTGKEKVLYSFAGGTDGQQPEAGLLDVDGVLYGTTELGGTGEFGTVFALDPATGVETVLYSFAGGTDGANPVAGLIAVDGVLYGTTAVGGTYYGGTVFALDPGTGAETVLYSFSGGADGGNPVAGLVDVGGVLYGTTEYGGGTGCDSGCGTVFSLDPGTGTETVLHTFAGVPDGAGPVAGLIAVDGVLYGTTELGGSKIECRGRGGCGTVFSIDPATGAEEVLYAFCGGRHSCNGIYPLAGLIDVHGRFYGTTGGGGSYIADGTVFSLKEKR